MNSPQMLSVREELFSIRRNMVDTIKRYYCGYTWMESSILSVVNTAVDREVVYALSVIRMENSNQNAVC